MDGSLPLGGARSAHHKDELLQAVSPQSLHKQNNPSLKETLQGYIDGIYSPNTHAASIKSITDWAIKGGSLMARANWAFATWKLGSKKDKKLAETMLEVLTLIPVDTRSLALVHSGELPAGEAKVFEQNRFLSEELRIITRRIKNEIKDPDRMFINCVDCAVNLLVDLENYLGVDVSE